MKLLTPARSGGSDWDSALKYISNRDRVSFNVPVSELSIDPETGHLGYGTSSFPMTRTAGTKLAALLGIAPNYVVKLPNELAAENFNAFLPSRTGDIQMVVEDGNVVAFLKTRTNPVDTLSFLDEIPQRVEDLTLGLWKYDEDGLTIRLRNPGLVVEPKVGDIVEAGVDVVVKENFDAALGVRGVMYRLTCTNGATAQEDAGLRKILIKEGWKEPWARVQIALDAVEETTQTMYQLAQGLKRLPKLELELPPTAEDRFLLINEGMAAIYPKPLKNKALVESVTEGSFAEDSTMFGLFNTLTRLGRDSADFKRRNILETAGFNLLLSYDSVYDAITSFNRED